MYRLAPFNPNTPYNNQVSTELNYANDNFTALGNAFLNSDPSSNPVLRASYIGSSAPSNPVAGMTWLDTSGILPVIRVYDGSNWKLPTIRRINGNSLTSDYALAIGEEAFYSWDTTSSTSLNLHINTSGGIYQIIINAPYNTSANINMVLYPNNTSYSNAIALSYISIADNSSTVSGASGSNSYFPLSYLGSGGLANILCSTYTDRKFMISEERLTYKDDGGRTIILSYRWNDTSTAWNSLGTLSTGSANGTIYVLVRRLV